MNIQDFASKLFGSSRIEESGDLSNRVDSITAAGATASEAGAVGVTLDAEITPADDSSETDETIIEMPTSPSVDVGDDVIIGLTGEGPLKVPVVLANPGSGDRVASQAQQAIDIAEATGQHFWDDDSGAHVTESTREEWEQQQTGPNSLWNSLGMLFRNGLNNLLAIVTGKNPGLQIYDGQGNADENILAEFSSKSVRLGRGFVGSGMGQSAVEFFDGKTQLNASHDADSTTATNNATIVSETNDADLATGEGYVARTSIGAWSTINSNNNNEIAAPTVSLIAHAGPELTGKEAELVLTASYDKNASARRTEVIVVAENVQLNNNSGPTGVGKFTMKHVIDMLTTSSTNLTRSSAVSSWSGGQVRRSGKVVTVTIVGMKLASALASNANSPAVTTVPAGYRPNVLQRVPAALAGSAGNYANVWAVVGGGGGVQIHNGSGLSIPTTMEISLSCTYIID